MWTWVLLAAVGVAAAVLLLGYNRLVRLRNRAESSYADIDVQLERRYDLIPNLVSTVQAYAAHERAAFDAVTAARSRAMKAVDRGDQAAQEAEVEQAVHRVLALAEAYPELQADARFRDLHDELVATENKLAFSRQLYNDTVQSYRDATQSFPGLLYAAPLGFTPPPFFRAEPAEREVVRADLDDPEG